MARGGKLVARSVYHEISSSEFSQAVRLDDAGSLSLDAIRFSCKTSEAPLVETSGFDGEFAIAHGMELHVFKQHRVGAATAAPASCDGQRLQASEHFRRVSPDTVRCSMAGCLYPYQKRQRCLRNKLGRSQNTDRT